MIVVKSSDITAELQWFALYTRPKAEKKVEERLSLAGFDSFLPLQTVIKQWSDRKKKVEIPLINSYVFVKTNKVKLNTLLVVPGVLNILKYLKKPAVVREEEIENLKILVNNNEDFISIDPIDLSKGEKVEVIKGSFKGLVGTFLKSSGKHRIIIEIEALKSFIEVSLPLNTIKSVN